MSDQDTEEVPDPGTVENDRRNTGDIKPPTRDGEARPTEDGEKED